MPEEDEPTPEEWAAIEAADAYLDAVGNKRDFDGDPLGLTEWRKDVDAEPVDMSQLPSAHTARGELPPATGGTMSQLSELAAQVAGHADLQSVIATLAEAEQQIQAKREALDGLLADTSHADAVLGAGNEASAAVAAALGPIGAFADAIMAAASAMRGGS